MKNPVAEHMHKSVRASVITSKRRSLQSEAALRDAREDAQNELVDSETMCFYSILEDGCNGCLNDIGSSSILVDFEED